jgi:hypothetical protein
VSGASLAVECDADIGFFPYIYNEDWLFLFDDASNRRLANSRLQATQLTYYPFANAKRAAWQEFGDVLAEGLYSLLHLGLKVEDATPEYWASFLKARRSFLEAILARSQNANPEIRGEMVASVESALGCLDDIRPELCASYVQAWRADLRDWKWRMAGITEVSLEDALDKMRLVPTAPASSTWRVMPHWDQAARTVTAGPVMIPQIDTLKHRLRDTKPLVELSDEVIAKTAAGGEGDGESLSFVGQARGQYWKSWQRMYSAVMILGGARSLRRASAGDNSALKSHSLENSEPVGSGQLA